MTTWEWAFVLVVTFPFWTVGLVMFFEFSLIAFGFIAIAVLALVEACRK